jgi:hypothetical protein
MGFAHFCSLAESLKPKETDYGTDGKNKKWGSISDEYHHTFFSHKPDHHVLVTLHKPTGELAFAVHRGEFSTDVSKHYNMEKQNSGDAHTVLGKALHVGLEGAKTHNMKHLMIQGGTPELKSAYEIFSKNKILQRHLNNAGWKHSHSDGYEHHFERV